MSGEGTSRDLRTALDALSSVLRGRFLVFEGPDGAGKSSQLKRLSRALGGRGLAVCEVRDPGGTHAGELIRRVLLDRETGELSVRCEMLLFMASRAQLCAEVIGPALGRGELVLADRFVSSTVAYQGSGGGLSEREILDVGRVATGGVGLDGGGGGVWPELVVVFDVDSKTAAGRLNPLLDRMEAKGEAFHTRVRESYLHQAEADPDRHLVIDAKGESDGVFAMLVNALHERYVGGTSGGRA